MAPLVLLGTWVTHLFGGSAGREGTALQMSGSLTDVAAKFELFVITEDVIVRDASEALACLSVHGPGAARVLALRRGRAANAAKNGGRGGLRLRQTRRPPPRRRASPRRR